MEYLNHAQSHIINRPAKGSASQVCNLLTQTVYANLNYPPRYLSMSHYSTVTACTSTWSVRTDPPFEAGWTWSAWTNSQFEAGCNARNHANLRVIIIVLLVALRTCVFFCPSAFESSRVPNPLILEWTAVAYVLAFFTGNIQFDPDVVARRTLPKLSSAHPCYWVLKQYKPSETSKQWFVLTSLSVRVLLPTELMSTAGTATSECWWW